MRQFSLNRLLGVCLGIAISTSVPGCGSPEEKTEAASESSATGTTSRTESTPTQLRFLDVASSSGVEFVSSTGESAGERTILETLGCGVGLFDFDNDGSLDILLPGGGSFSEELEILGASCGLFRNHGQWKFTNEADSAYVSDSSLYSHGVAVGDYDNDGWSDFLITGYGGLQLFHNLGDGTFEELAKPAGISSDLWNTSSGWADLDADGDLDLYLARYVNWSFDNHPRCQSPVNGEFDVCPPGVFSAEPDVWFESLGDGQFASRGMESGLQEGGMGLAVLLADLDQSGSVDVYVANDTNPNQLYRNDGAAVLAEVGVISGTALGNRTEADGSMGVEVCDYNLDGRFDLWVSNFEDQSFAMYRNDGSFLFQHVSNSIGISDVGGVFVGFGTVARDFDQDGDEDLFAANGHVMHASRNASFQQAPLLFENRFPDRFRDVAEQAGDYCASRHMGRGVAAGDLDGDGDLDMVVSHSNQPVAILRNESLSPGNWLAVDLTGQETNREAIGATVKVTADGKAQVRTVFGGGSFLSSSGYQLHFGLADSNQIDEIEVRWPSGSRTRLAKLAPNQILHITEDGLDHRVKVVRSRGIQRSVRSHEQVTHVHFRGD